LNNHLQLRQTAEQSFTVKTYSWTIIYSYDKQLNNRL